MKALPFLVQYATTSDISSPASNLAVLTTQPKEWVSARFCTYPQEIVLQFQSNMHIKKIQFLSHEKKITSKVEIYVGRLWKSANRTVDYSALGADGVKFDRIGYFTFSPNDQSNWTARELKTVAIEQNECTYVRLVLHKNHDNRYNLFGQVSIVAIRVYGEVDKLPPPSQGRLRDIKTIIQHQDEEQREELLIDANTMQQIYGLQYQLVKQKDQAVRMEDFEQAKQLKVKIEELKQTGMLIKELEERKKFAIQNEDYDTAQQIKRQILEHRVKAGQIDEFGRGLRQPVYQAPQNIDPQPQQQPQPQEYPHSHERHLTFEDTTNIVPSPVLRTNQDYPTTDDRPRFDDRPPSEDFDRDYQDQENSIPAKHIYNHDEQVIPALAKKNKAPEDILAEQPENVEEQPESISLHNEKLSEPLIPIFGAEFCMQLFSKQWAQREKAFHWLTSELGNPTKLKIDPKEKVFQYVMEVCQIGVADKIEKVVVASLQSLETLMKKIEMKPDQMQKGEIPITLDGTILLLMEKAGDPSLKTKEEVERVVMTMADVQSVGTIPIINHLLKGITTKPKLQQSAKYINPRLQITYQLIRKYKIKNEKIPFYPVFDLAIRHLDHPSEVVRSSAIQIIGEAYRNQKDLVRQNIVNVRQAIRVVLEEVFRRIDKGENYDAIIDHDKNRKQAVEQNIQQNKQHNTHKEQQQMQLLDEQVITQCDFCGQSNKEFGKNNQLDLHLWRECPMLTTCQSCAQVVEIQSLSHHHLEECEKSNSYRECTRCGVTVIAENLQSHLNENVCKSAKGDICPLCYELINAQEGWRSHLFTCKKNDRKVK